MKHLWIGLLLLNLLAFPAVAGTYPLGVGAYGGYDFPVIQTDVGAGPMWSVGVRGNIWKFLHGQLFVRGTSQGDAEEDLTGTPETIKFKGGSLTGFGLNVLLARKTPANVWPYGLIGFSSNQFSPGDSWKKDETLTGWSFGGGMGINLYHKQVYLDLNAGLLVMPIHDNKASRKNAQALIGIQYFIPIKTGTSNAGGY